MGAKRAKGNAALIVDEAFKAAVAHEVALLAHQIKARDKCTDDEAVERAMQEYHRIAREVNASRNDLKDAQARKRQEDALRADGKPTLSTSLGDRFGGSLAALRDKLPAKR